MQILYAQGFLSNQGALISVKGESFMSIHGDVLLQNGGVFDNSDTVYVFGDWVNESGTSGFSNSGDGRVWLSGDTQHIRGTDTTIFYELGTIGTGVKYGDLDAYAEGSLDLFDRELNMDTNVFYVTNPDISAVTNDSTGFVSSLATGGLSRVTNSIQDYFYPVGSSVNTLRYRPIWIKPESTNSHAYRVRMAHVDATSESFDRSLREATICEINPFYYHRVYQDNGTDAADITMSFDSFVDGAFNENTHWQGQPQWERMPPSVLLPGFHQGLDAVQTTSWNDFTTPAFALSEATPIMDLLADSTFCLGDTALFVTDSGYIGYDFYVNGVLIYQDSLPYFFTTQLQNGDSIYVIAQDSNCIARSFGLTVTVFDNPIADAGQDDEICIQDSIDLQASGGLDYNWNTGDSTSVITVYPTIQTIYTVTVTDGNGCKDIDSVSVEVNPLPIVQAFSDQDLCIYDTIVLTALGAIDYQWSTGDTNSTIAVNPQVSTDYVVVGTDANGCRNIDTVSVNVLPLPDARAFDDADICLGDSIILQAEGGAVYVWNTGQTGTPITVAPNTTSTYTVVVTDTNGCVNSDDVTIIVKPLPAVDAGNDTIVIPGATVQLQGTSGTGGFEWTPSDSLSCTFCPDPLYIANQTQEFILIVDNAANGCSNRDTVLVIVDPDIDPEDILQIPNAITPNGDGVNEVWNIKNLELYSDNDVVIVNRWGDEVFRASPYQNDWDGTYQGKKLPDGTYYFILNINSAGKSFNGPLTIVR